MGNKNRTKLERLRVTSLIEALRLSSRHASQVSPDFILGMASRMAMSFEKYGDISEAYPDKLDAMACAELRIEKYRETGNTEYLIDAANFIMIEFMLPRHAHAHFKAEDSSASPGRVDTSGRKVGAQANTHARENVRRGGAANKTDGGFYGHEGD
jgi:hypothetical protein